MGWMVYLAKIAAKSGKAAGKVGNAASKASKTPQFIKAFNKIKLGSWLKVGAAGGLGVTIYSGWTSLVGSFSKATGLSEENSGTVLFLVFGLMVVWILVSVFVPKQSGGGFVNYHISGPSDRMYGRYDKRNRRGRR